MALFHFCLLVTFISLVGPFCVQAQDQSGFVSIDCGLPDGSRYRDEKTDINYISDAEFVESGTSRSIDPKFQTSSLEIQFNNVRSFPEGKRNCYDIQPKQGKGSKYLIRARFMYGNYDSLDKVPEFDLYLGVNLWDSVTLDNATTIVTKEIIYTLDSDHVQVCLFDKGKGTAFISVLELRLLNSNIYETPYDKLMLVVRRDVGSISNVSVRYKDDAYDRLWTPRQLENFTLLNTPLAVDQNSNNNFQLPLIVMRTANAPRKAIQYINMFFEPEDPKGKFYIFMHFAEIVELQRNETREFTILVNGEPIEPLVFSPRFLVTDTISTKSPVSGSRIEISIRPTNRSTLQPILNAIESYQVNEFIQSATHQLDVDAIRKIKAIYKVKKNWQGDPCVPVDYSWDGINCENPPRIVSLNLSSSGLSGLIDPAFCNLTSVQKLDLSNNSLQGNVLDCFGYLPSLNELNLEGNELTGLVPRKLQERSRTGSLKLSMGGNPGLFLSSSCQEMRKNKGYIVPLVASIVGVLIF